MVDSTESIRERLERKWAERDRKREEREAYYENQRMASRAHYIGIVTAAGVPEHWAAQAVDALKAEGVVFAYLSPCGDDAG
jgi:hypothetical protein